VSQKLSDKVETLMPGYLQITFARLNECTAKFKKKVPVPAIYNKVTVSLQ